MTVTTLPTAAGHTAEGLNVTYVPAPPGTPTDTPRVFVALNAAMRGISPVGKNQENTQQRYKFRGVDDVMSAVAGPFREHGLFILPQMIDRTSERRGEKMTSVTVVMRYHVYGPAGDCLIATVPGEASDFADKATNKAQSAAMKYLLVHLFMIPVDAKSVDDGDRDHPVEPTSEHRAERQRQQQRRQSRRSGRAEPGPWEAPGPQQGAEFAPHPGAQGLAERAAKAQTRSEVNAIAEEAKSSAPPDAQVKAPDTGRQDTLRAYLGRRWKALPEQPEPAGPRQPDAPPTPPVDDHAAAVAELRAAAEAARLEDFDNGARMALGMPIEQASADAIRALAAQIRPAA